MPDYKYQGTSRSGGSVSGVMTASNKTELATLLKRQQITATKMTEKGKEFNIPTFGGGVKAKELAIFTRQFSVMIDAGLPLVQRLSTYIEKNVKLQRAVKSALVYPVGVLTVAGGVITLLLWKVVPIFATLFAGLGVDLPLATKIVIGLSNFIGSIFGLLILVALGAGIFGLKVWYGTKQGRFVLDTIVLKLPVLGVLMRKIAVARFTRTLGTLISSGVPILEGLD